MNKIKILILLILSLLTFSSCLNTKRTTEINDDNQQNASNILKNEYVENDINISYPEILGLQDGEKDIIINEILKKEAFCELSDWEQSNDNSINGISLSIEYNILYQTNEFLCVNYIGYTYIDKAAYPRSIFTTVNIDLINKDRLQLKDIIDINDSFINILKSIIKQYIDKNPDFEIIYRDMLEHDDEYFRNLLTNADSTASSDCFSYFTPNSLGISFATSHVAGDHFEIEIPYEIIEEFILLNIY